MLRKLIIMVKHQCVASLNGHLEVIKWLYDHGGKDDVTKADNFSQTPMYAASLNGHLEVIKWLYDHGGKYQDVTKANNFSQTPMYVASLNGHLEVIKWLMTGGKDDVTKADNDNKHQCM